MLSLEKNRRIPEFFPTIRRLNRPRDRKRMSILATETVIRCLHQ